MVKKSRQICRYEVRIYVVLAVVQRSNVPANRMDRYDWFWCPAVQTCEGNLQDHGHIWVVILVPSLLCNELFRDSIQFVFRNAQHSWIYLCCLIWTSTDSPCKWHRGAKSSHHCRVKLLETGQQEKGNHWFFNCFDLDADAIRLGDSLYPSSKELFCTYLSSLASDRKSVV